MSEARFKPVWSPRDRGRRAPNAPAIPDEVWEAHRPLIEQLYRGMKLQDVMNLMRCHHGFSQASKRQYTRKLKEWGCGKYKLLFMHDQGSVRKRTASTSVDEEYIAPLNSSLRSSPDYATPDASVLLGNEGSLDIHQHSIGLSDESYETSDNTLSLPHERSEIVDHHDYQLSTLMDHQPYTGDAYAIEMFRLAPDPIPEFYDYASSRSLLAQGQVSVSAQSSAIFQHQDHVFEYAGGTRPLPLASSRRSVQQRPKELITEVWDPRFSHVLLANTAPQTKILAS